MPPIAAMICGRAARASPPRFGRGEVIASTFDEPVEDHTRVAEAALERAKVLVLQGDKGNAINALRGFMALSLEITDAHVDGVVADVADILASTPVLKVA